MFDNDPAPLLLLDMSCTELRYQHFHNAEVFIYIILNFTKLDSRNIHQLTWLNYQNNGK